jgi:Protein of unknown function (DUF1698)
VKLHLVRSAVRTTFHRAKGLGQRALVGVTQAPPQGRYAAAAPSPQQVLDLFKGEWSSVLPAPYCECEAGRQPMFGDPRLKWGVEQLGGVTGCRVVELGPLEGGHTWMLEQLGAAEITAIEASDRAYLKCLTVKELTGLRRARFLYGDAVAYLRESSEHFDVGIASGILYHMTNPVELLALLAACCDRLYLWTHYYDETALLRHPIVRARFHGSSEATHAGFTHTLHRYRYQASRFRLGFSGGRAPHSYWLTRDTIIAACRHLGFTRIEIAFDDPNHPYGPSCALVALR